MNKILYTVFGVCALSLMVLLSGCGGGKAAVESPTSEIQDFEPVTEVKDGQKNIYVILKVMTSQYWQDIIHGITDAAKEVDCNVYVGGVLGEGDWVGQKKLIDRVLDEGNADAFVVAPSSSSMLAESIGQIYTSGKPVVLVDTIINGENFDTCFMTDNIIAGELEAQEVLKQMADLGVSKEKPADIAIQIPSTSSQTIIDRLAGFNQYWAVNAPGNWRVLDEVRLNDGDKEKAKQIAVDLLEKYPDIKCFLGCNNSSTVGFVNAIKEKDRSDILMVGFDYADETAELVASDRFRAATLVQNQYDMGYKGLKQTVDILNGGKPEYKFVDTGVVVVNHDNYKQYEAEVGKK